MFENQKRKYYDRRTMLPNVQFIVIDESHNLEEKGRNSFKQDSTLKEALETINRTQSVLSRVSYYNTENIEVAQKPLINFWNIENASRRTSKGGY